MPDKTVRDELAELTTAIQDLRDNEVATELRNLRAEVERLRAEQGAHHCGCTCTHLNITPAPYVPPASAPWVYPTQIWCGTVTSGSSTDPRMASAVTTSLPGDVTATGAVGSLSYAATAN